MPDLETSSRDDSVAKGFASETLLLSSEMFLGVKSQTFPASTLDGSFWNRFASSVHGLLEGKGLIKDTERGAVVTSVESEVLNMWNKFRESKLSAYEDIQTRGWTVRYRPSAHHLCASKVDFPTKPPVDIEISCPMLKTDCISHIATVGHVLDKSSPEGGLLGVSQRSWAELQKLF